MRAAGMVRPAGPVAGVAGLLGLALLGLVWLGTATAAANFPGQNGQIAFQSTRAGGATNIHTINPDGGCPTQLTDHPTFDGFPAWAPKGQRIAFRSDRDGVAEIYVMNADGSDQRRLTRNPSFDGGAAWSPDGQRIAFRSDRDGSPEIYAMNADGSDQTRLTENPGADWAPSWSPDGRRIAFASIRDDPPEGSPHATTQIYVMNADGSNLRRVTDVQATDGAPDWSPDGRRIAFDSDRVGDQEDIWAINADGSGAVRLTDDPLVEGGPVWSPDGEQIVFRSYRNRVNEVHVINADGSDETRLTRDRWSNRRAAWQPLALPSNNFCLGRQGQNTRRGFARQRVRVPGPGAVTVRRSERVMRFVREAEEAGWVRVLVRPRGRPKRRLDRAGTVRRRVQANVRAAIAFRPEGGRARSERVRAHLVRVARR